MIQFAQYRTLPKGYSLYVTGDCDQLGQWVPVQSIRMTCQKNDTWTANLNFGKIQTVKFKYFTAHTDNPELDLEFDEGDYRTINLSKMEQTNQLNIMTFNIRFDGNEEGDRNWNKRKNLVCQTIQQVNPDILGLQEVLVNQKQYLEEQLENYNLIGRSRKAKSWEGEGCPIMYNILKFNLLNLDIFWLSDTPHKPGSNSYGNKIHRICVYAKLQNKYNNSIINVYSTHLDHRHAVSQVKSAIQIKNHMKDTCQINESIVLLGDMNCFPQSEPIQIFENEIVPLQNTMGPQDFPLATYHGWHGKKQGRHIDYIFVRNLKWKKTYIMNEKINGQYASDHYAKIAECQIQQ